MHTILAGMKYIILFLFPITLLVSCGGSQQAYQEQASVLATAPTQVLYSIQSLAGKTPKQVQALYGKPDIAKGEVVKDGPCKSKICRSYAYKKGALEIVYINGKADWITVNDVAGQSLSAEAIQLLGLPATEPSFSNPGNVIRWGSVGGLHEVSAFSDGNGGISYFHIMAETPL